MEILFENEYIRDKSTAKEVWGYWFFKRPLFIAVHIILGLYIVTAILSVIQDTDTLGMVFTNLFLMLLCEGAIFLSYFSQVKAFTRRDDELRGDRPMLYRSEVTDSEITVFALDSKQTVNLSVMRQAYITKNYIVLISSARYMWILKRDGFTVGDPTGFVDLIRSKSIRIKGKL